MVVSGGRGFKEGVLIRFSRVGVPVDIQGEEEHLQDKERCCQRKNELCQHCALELWPLE